MEICSVLSTPWNHAEFGWTSDFLYSAWHGHYKDSTEKVANFVTVYLSGVNTLLFCLAKEQYAGHFLSFLYLLKF